MSTWRFNTHMPVAIRMNADIVVVDLAIHKISNIQYMSYPRFHGESVAWAAEGAADASASPRRRVPRSFHHPGPNLSSPGLHLCIQQKKKKHAPLQYKLQSTTSACKTHTHTAIHNKQRHKTSL